MSAAAVFFTASVAGAVESAEPPSTGGVVVVVVVLGEGQVSGPLSPPVAAGAAALESSSEHCGKTSADTAAVKRSAAPKPRDVG
jgi:hypothetical protein